MKPTPRTVGESLRAVRRMVSPGEMEADALTATQFFMRETRSILVHDIVIKKHSARLNPDTRNLKAPANYNRVVLIRSGCAGMAGSFGVRGRSTTRYREVIGEL